jgi:hypothetical protein
MDSNGPWPIQARPSGSLKNAMSVMREGSHSETHEQGCKDTLIDFIV